jgi:hypothetical protein
MNYLKTFWNAIFLMTVAVSFCAFNASGATVNAQEVAPTYVGFVYGKFGRSSELYLYLE